MATPASEPETGSSPSDEPSAEEDEAYWRPSAEQMADDSFEAEETSDAASDDAAAEKKSEDVSSEAHVLRTPAPDSEPGAMLSDASLAASERERYAAMLRERTSAARAIRESDEPWDYVFEPGDFELCTPRAPTREEKEPFGREYKYLAQNKDGLASDWCDAVFRDGREDPSGACEALEEDEKRAEATRLDASAEMPPPPPPPPPPMTRAEAAEEAEVREPQWRPPQFSVWPRVREEGDGAEQAETRAEAEDDAAAPEAPEEDASSKTDDDDDDDDDEDASDFEVRAEDFVNPHEGVPFDDDDDDGEWHDAGEGYSSERPWDANSDEEEDETDAEDAEETVAASRADFFERVAAAEAEAESAESAESAVSADEPDTSLPPKLPEDKPKGKSKWARLKDD